MKYANMKNVITQHHIVALSSAKKVPSNALPTNNLWKMDSLVSPDFVTQKIRIL